MIGRRHFIRLAALMGGGALTGALLTRAQAAAAAAGPPPATAWFLDEPPPLVEAPAYVRWPVDHTQAWVRDYFGSDIVICSARWRVYDESIADPESRATQYGLGCSITAIDAVGQTERGRLTVQAFNRCLENARQHHGFPEQMIHWAVRAPSSQVRWRRTAEGGYQPYWPRPYSDTPELVGFAYPPEKG